jgi:hypothetical protein
MGEADKLKEMIDNAPQESEDTQASIDQVDEQIAEWQEKQDALEFTMDECCYNVDAGIVHGLLPTKADAVATYDDFSNTNAAEWLAGDAELDNNDGLKDDITKLSATQFECDNDHSSEFSVSQTVGFVFNNTNKSGTKSDIQAVDYNITTLLKTTVTLNDGVLTSTPISSIIPSYVYNGIGWDSDADIQARIDEFAYSYNHVTEPMGTAGTYGTEDNIAKLNMAKQLLTANKGVIDGRADSLGTFSS